MIKVVPKVLPGNLESLFLKIKDHLRYVSRFTLPNELMSKLLWILDYYESVGDSILAEDETLYRARLHKVNQRNAFSSEEMGAPPPNSASAGRLNPAGLPYFYSANNAKTAIAEIRPWTGALVSVGIFTALKNLRVLDFTKRASVNDADSPAMAVHSAISEALFVHKHFGAPVHRDDNLSYLPMQFITDLVRQRGYDGIRFASLQVKGGKNTVLFASDNTNCKSVLVYGVGNISYESQELPETPPELTVGKHKIVGRDW